MRETKNDLPDDQIDPQRRRMTLGLIFSALQGRLMVDKFYTFVFNAATSTTAGIAAGLTVQNRMRVADQSDAEARLAKEMSEMGKRLLFGSGASQHAVPSVDNPFSPQKGITKPTADAVASVATRLGLDKNELVAVDDLAMTELQGSFVFFGGPVANVYSRHILGIGQGSPLLEGIGRNASLPIQFDIVTPVQSGARVNYFEGTGSRPSWKLVVRGRSVAVSTQGGQQSSDFLLLTSLPNVYSTHAGLGDRITIVAGAHGAGTRAIDLLLSNPKLLERIKKETTGIAGWQALLRVLSLDKLTGLPRELGEEVVFPIAADFDALNDKLAGKPFGWRPPVGRAI